MSLPVETLWCCEPDRFSAMLDSARAANLATLAGKARNPILSVDNGVATVNITGPLEKSPSLFSLLFGGTGLLDIAAAVDAAAANPNVRSILLYIDSPGGTTAGTSEAADAVARAAKVKPVTAAINDLGASAAYWIASQANRIVANNTAWVGSIGTYMVARDLSKAFSDAGVKVHIVKAGEFKGVGFPGTPVTPEQLADTQRLVDSTNQTFLAAVGRGRRMNPAKVQAIADGRVHVANDALSSGLIDGIENFQATLANLHSSKGKTMSESTAATLAELDAAMPNASSDFKLDQLRKGATVADAQSAYIKTLEANAKTSTRTARPGVDPLANGRSDATSSHSDPIGAWHEAVESELKANGGDRARAVQRADKKNPGLREQMVAAYNAEHGRVVGELR